MTELAQRNTSARSIRNVLAYTQKDDFQTQSILDLKSRGEHLVNAWKRFKTNHEVLVQNALDAELEEHNQLFDEIEEAYFAAGGNLQNRLSELEQPVDNESDDSSSVHSFYPNDNQQQQENDHENNMDNRSETGEEMHNSPPVQSRTEQANSQLNQKVQPIYVQCGSNRRIENYWGEFDGTLTKWRAFHDGFKAAIHDDESISPVFKFQYLKNSLKGKALTAFGEWELTADNYAEAWEQLKEMYQLKYQTSQELVFKFLNLPKIDHPAHESIERLSTVTNGVIRQLRALQYPVQHYDLFIVHCLHQKLDSGLSKDWEKERNSETPTAADMLAFLNKQAKSCKSAYVTDTRKRTSNFKSYDNDAKRSRPSTFTATKPTQKLDNRQCKVCKGNHAVHKCDKFLKLNLSDRKKCAREHELCFNCLHPSHASRECRASNCKRCDKKHNSLLCPENPFNRSVNSVQQQSITKATKKRNKWLKRD